MMKILVTGASGFLGQAMVRELAARHEVAAVGRSRAGGAMMDCDLRDAAQVRALTEGTRPDAVIVSAAYRDPDFCEANPDEARRLNVGAAEHFAAALDEGTPIVFISSDYVFEGTNPPYREDSERKPVNVYGRTKVLAEDVILPRRGGLVLRIPLLIGGGATWSDAGLIGKIAAAVRTGAPLSFDDVAVRHPTWIDDVAAAAAFLLERNLRGCFHYTGREGITMLGLARLIARGLDGTADSFTAAAAGPDPRRARRPADAHLDSAKIVRAGFTRATPLEGVIAEVRRRLDGGGAGQRAQGSGSTRTR
jgi:dTDP-4-dehydrorhamnose reductase